MAKDIDAAVAQAVTMFWNGPDHPKARAQFQSIVETNPDHLVAQWFLFQCEMIDGDIAAAKARGEVLVRLSANNPIMLLSRVRALVAAGDLESARRTVLAHMSSQPPVTDRANLGTNEAADAVMLELVGEKERSFQMSRAMCRDDDVPLADWSAVEDADGFAATLEEMRARVGGRDICIFGRGPSLNALEDSIAVVRDHDFVPFVINEFQDVAASILAKAGKRPGLVSITGYQIVQACADAIRALCTAEEFIGLALPAYARTELESSASEKDIADALSRNSRRIFSYDCEGELNLPIPRRPITFPIVNTMLHALGTAVLLKPRRIFLFGFDGAVSPDTGQNYYAEHYKDMDLEKGWRNRMAQWLWWDSFRASHIAPVFINHLHLLHDVDYPLIYNVCKHSAITCFPRIGLDDYAALAGGRP